VRPTLVNAPRYVNARRRYINAQVKPYVNVLPTLVNAPRYVDERRRYVNEPGHYTFDHLSAVKIKTETNAQNHLAWRGALQTVSADPSSSCLVTLHLVVLSLHPIAAPYLARPPHAWHGRGMISSSHRPVFRHQGELDIRLRFRHPPPPDIDV
jgi:hypothetical protein